MSQDLKRRAIEAAYHAYNQMLTRASQAACMETAIAAHDRVMSEAAPEPTMADQWDGDRTYNEAPEWLHSRLDTEVTVTDRRYDALSDRIAVLETKLDACGNLLDRIAALEAKP